MQGIKLKVILYIFVFVMLSPVVFGQTFGFISIDQAYESNPFRYPDAKSSWVSELSTGIQYDWNRFSISYSGTFSRFETMMERNFYFHQIAIFGQYGKTDYGLNFEQNLNKNDFDIYNSNKWSAYMNQYFELWSINFYGSLNGEINNYSELENLDNYKLEAGLKIHKSFETGTTVILGSNLHYKNYLNSNVYVTQDTINQSGSGGHGNGRFGGGGGSYISYTYQEDNAPSVSQLQVWLRLAQSVTQSTGLALQVQSRILMSGTSRYISGLSYNYANESQIFDDPLGYESVTIGGELTQLLPYSIVAKSAYYFSKKDYSVQGIYSNKETYDDSVLRNDTRNYAWLSLQRSFKYNILGDTGVMIKLMFFRLKNDSNSYWYNYTNQYSNIEISFDF